MHFPVLVDTGCHVNILSMDVASALGLYVEQSESVLSGIGDGKAKVVGHVWINLSIGNYKHRESLKFLVSTVSRVLHFWG